MVEMVGSMLCGRADRTNLSKSGCVSDNKTELWVHKMSHPVKALATKPDKLSSIPGTYMMEGKHRIWKIVLELPTTCALDYMHVNTHLKMSCEENQDSQLHNIIDVAQVLEIRTVL